MLNSFVLQRIRPVVVWCGVGLTLASIGVSRATYLALAVNITALLLYAPNTVTWWRTAGHTRWAWVYLAFISVVSLRITAFPETTYVQVARLGEGMTLALVLQVTTTHTLFCLHAKKITFMLGILGCGLVLSTCLLVDRITVLLPKQAQPIVQIASRLASDDVNPNVLGGLAAFFFSVSLSAWLFDAQPITHSVRQKVITPHGIMTLLLFCAVIASQSRGAWIATMIVLMTLVVLRWRRVGTVLILVCVIASIVTVALIGTSEAFRIITFNGGKEGPAYRLEVWARAIYVIQDFMFTGVGMGNFQPVVDKLYPFALAPGDVPHAHNIFLQIAVDLGVPGLFAWVTILVSVFHACWRTARGKNDGDAEPTASSRTLALGILMAQVSMCVHSLIDAVLWGMVRTAPLVWLLWGTALALHHVRYTQRLHA